MENVRGSLDVFTIAADGEKRRRRLQSVFDLPSGKLINAEDKAKGGKKNTEKKTVSEKECMKDENSESGRNGDATLHVGKTPRASARESGNTKSKEEATSEIIGVNANSTSTEVKGGGNSKDILQATNLGDVLDMVWTDYGGKLDKSFIKMEGAGGSEQNGTRRKWCKGWRG
ncbi:hypothetical protein K469DRAFT_694967 [Zopfia rhizophila CBS 207.26]|uniref:Uncharacterized protein n=1 Tax=Zopfia rhizophila CBS 207.26 TaxID=1314779 RepID=A0A6A6DKU0_9PEZI|nr:hypothetical protein K469DRAFT_694967 [Zopfia rhizophila CBS 207.26]